MSVRLSMLAILDQGACYGYQLRAEYARRTGAALNVGQIYTTLERLERDGLVDKRGADERGHVYWGITAAGRDEVRSWFAAPERPAARNELALKVALAATLPGVDAGAIIATERDRAADRLSDLDDADPGDASDILRAAERAHLAADVAWLDAVAATVAADRGARAYSLSEERPRRGRPVRSGAQAG